MKNINDLVMGLKNKDNKTAYQCLLELEQMCNLSNAVYPYFDDFAVMLDSKNSYIRTRGIILIADNAKWDKDHKIDEIIDEFLILIMDEKPITSRQCINALPKIAKYKPDLKDTILNALKKARPMYNSNMQPLIDNDIKNAIKNISEQ